MSTITCERCGRQHIDERGTAKCTLCGTPLPGSTALDIPPEEEPRRPTFPSSGIGQMRSESSSGQFMNRCPECGKGEMIPSEGCALCPLCGYSPCSK